MCGRFALHLPHNDLRQLDGYDAHPHEWLDQHHFVPRYNIAPRTQAPVLRLRGGNSLVMHTMKWGLVPHWSKFEDKTLNTTNARSENLVDGGGMWARIKGKNRCVVVCQGYYEWLKKGKDKLPHFTKRKDGKLMLMAGLYDSVVLEGQTDTLWTFTIVTTAANSDFEWLHDRQPVILSNEDALRTWLDTSSQTWTPELTKLVEPYHDTASPLECYQVPKEVGKVGTESPTYIQPIADRKDGIEAMFSKQKKQPKVSPQPTGKTIHDLSEDTPPPASSRPHKHEIDLTLDSDEERKPKKVKTEKSKTGKESLKASPIKSIPPKPNNPDVKITSFFNKT